MYIEHLKPFGIKIHNVLLKDITNRLVNKICKYMDSHQLVVIPKQELNAKTWVKICHLLGTVIKYSYFIHPQHPEILLVTPKIKKGKSIGVFGDKSVDWHTNGTARQNPENGLGLYCVQPGLKSVISFVNCHLVYKDLSGEQKKFYEKIKIYFKYSNKRLLNSKGLENDVLKKMGEGVVKPLCIKSLTSNKKAVYFGVNYIDKVEGFSKSEQADFIKRLSKICFQEKYIYHHNWSAGDCLFADQYLTQHKRTGFEGERLLYRTVFYYGAAIKNMNN